MVSPKSGNNDHSVNNNSKSNNSHHNHHVSFGKTTSQCYHRDDSDQVAEDEHIMNVINECLSVGMATVASTACQYAVDKAIQWEAFWNDENNTVPWVLLPVLLFMQLIRKILFPSKVALYGTRHVPGMFHGMHVFWIQRMTGVFPSLPCRLCEYVMGRMRTKAFCLVAIIHFLVPVAILKVLASFQIYLVGDCDDAHRHNIDHENFCSVHIPAGIMFEAELPNTLSFLICFGMEVLAVTAFTVAILVLPCLCSLNRIPIWILYFLLYPIYNLSVDERGRGSTLNPVGYFLLFALGAGKEQPKQSKHKSMFFVSSSWRAIPQVMGGFVAAKMMNLYFPDAKQSSTRHKI